MSDSTASVTFLPWVRRGAATQIQRVEDPATVAGTSGARATLPVSVVLNSGNRTASMNVDLFGPQDILGVDPRVFIRVSPTEDALHAVPTDLPFVEISEADLPWRFTSAGPGGVASRLSPWLRLIVLRETEILSYDPPGANRTTGVLEVSAASALPPPDQAWAWAHVQVTGPSNPTEEALKALLNSEPQRFTARLFCPRRLAADTTYRAFVVPVFDWGRRAALGQAQDPMIPVFDYSWSSTGTPPLLPVYFSWTFRTGPAEDFESLARRINPKPAAGTLGGRKMDVSSLDFLLDPPTAEPLTLEGALVAAASTPPIWTVDWEDALGTLLDQNTNAIESAPGTTFQQVVPPLYGRWHAAKTKFTTSSPLRPWFQALNVDPRFRVAAGLGTEIVHRNQRQLMASAWEQLGGLRGANDLLRNGQLAREASTSIFERDFEGTDDETFVALSAPMQDHVLQEGGAATVAKSLKWSVVDVGVMGGSWRKLTRSRGPLGRRQGRNVAAPAPGAVARVCATDSTRLRAAVLPSAPRSMSTPVRWSDSIGTAFNPNFALGGVTDNEEELPLWATLLFALSALEPLYGTPYYSSGAWKAVLDEMRDGPVDIRDLRADVSTVIRTQIQGRPNFTVAEVLDTSPATSPMGNPGVGTDSASAAEFRAAVLDLVANLETDFGTVDAPASVSLADVRQRMETAIHPSATVAAGILTRVHLDGRITWNPADNLEPVMAYPTFPQPLYRTLVEISPNWLLPGMEAVAPDSVTVLTVNQQFIEALMVGASHEMARELLWNEYPTDQRGTYFKQFWDASGYVAATEQDQPAQIEDITEIHLWGNSALGSHRPASPGTSGAAQLVLVVRAELLRRFPGTSVYMAKGQPNVGPPTSEEQLHPIFSGDLPPDTRFFGFDISLADARGGDGTWQWYFILEEQGGETRFGLDDIGDTTSPLPAMSTWNKFSWQHAGVTAVDGFANIAAGFPATNPDATDGAMWRADQNSTSAHLAFIAQQRLVRVAIPATQLLFGL